MNMLRENMRLITECSQQLVRLGENLFAKGITEEDVDLIPKFGEYSDNEPLDVPTMTTEFVKEHGLPCPEGYIFKDENNNVINTTKIVLEKKKKEYPKTYEECRDLIEGSHVEPFCADLVATGYLSKLMERFARIIMCRDAYWLIAGKEMGLSEPWKPDWKNGCYVIFTNGDGLIERDIQFGINAILAFPTEEMRDAFKENFKSEIERCKELL